MEIKKTLESAAAKKVIDYLVVDPENRIRRALDLMDRIAPQDLYSGQRRAIRGAIERRDNWYKLLMKVFDLDRDYATKLVKAFAVDANLACWPELEKNRSRYGCNIPWAVLLDPTSACNLRCTGCWAADYEKRLDLSFQEIDSIIEQGKSLGIHLYIYTGGEPLVRKDDLIKLCEKHQDCVFLSFTNGTLIDEAFCDEMLRVANFVPSISVEGFADATDSRRGSGTFERVVNAMTLMKERGLAFGASCCYTSANVSDIATERFIDWLIEQGALFAWFFTYMPIGANAPTDLMVSASQREGMYHFIRRMRGEKPLFTMDFWNDGEFVGGCIAGGRRYLHISSAGDVEPCVFAHYANANIHDSSLLDALRSPLFMAYREAQPFSQNLLRPCPILDNSGVLAELVEKSGAASTNPMGGEEAAALCGKCREAAEAWEPVANRLWENPLDPRHAIRKSGMSGLAETDQERLAELGRIAPGSEAPVEPR